AQDSGRGARRVCSTRSRRLRRRRHGRGAGRRRWWRRGGGGRRRAAQDRRLRRDHHQARRAHAAVGPGGRHRRAADRGQRGRLRGGQRQGRHRGQVQGRARPGGHAVQARPRGPEVQQDQGRGRRHRPEPRDPADPGARPAAQARQPDRPARVARRVLGQGAEPPADRRALPDPVHQRPGLLRQAGGRGQEDLLDVPGRRLRRGGQAGRRLRGRAARVLPGLDPEVQGGRQGRDGPDPAASPGEVRRGLPDRRPQRRGHDLRHRRQARLRAALDRPERLVDRRARRLAARRLPQAERVDRRRGHGVGRREGPRHEADGRRRREVRPRAGARLLLRLRLQRGHGDDRAAREGGGDGRPLQGRHEEGDRPARHGLLQRPRRRLPVRRERGSQPAARVHHLRGGPRQAVQPRDPGVQLQVPGSGAVRVQAAGLL
ncbi:MAG: hypothetical protein AVDCRST_MAG13-1398, partial [uncultured Solirubrobacteraceae bacterium]